MAIITPYNHPKGVQIPGSGPKFNILHPKQQNKFHVEFSFDNNDCVLANQVVKVAPKLGTAELLVTFQDDVHNGVVRTLMDAITEQVAVTVKQLCNDQVLCEWTYEGTLEDFQFETHTYETGAAVEIVALIDVDHWDIVPR